MNSAFSAAFRSKAGTVGTFASTEGEPSPVDPALRERLSGALNDLEGAQRRGDPAEIGFAEFCVDKLRDEARAARLGEPPAGERPRNDDGTFAPTSSDGGVRGRGTVKPPAGMRPEPTAGALMGQAIRRSREERRERETSHTMTANL